MPRYTSKQLAAALKENRGLIYSTAERIGCSPNTLKKRIGAEPALAEAVEDAQGLLLDLAEGGLAQKIEEGDLGAIKYVLSTKGKDRGYGESTEVRVTGGVDVEHRHSFGFGDFAALFAGSVRPQLSIPDPDRIIEQVDTPHSNGKASLLPDAAGS